MERREFLLGTTAATLAASGGARADTLAQVPRAPELDLTDIAAALAGGGLNSRQLTQFYLERIDNLNRQGPMLGAVLETNPRALEIAAALDAEHAAGRRSGPLHGVPILLKDNVESADHMMTTAGSLALAGWYAPADAPLVARLRGAGAVILGKANLSEWANFRSTHSVSGWSGRGGQTRNPHVLNRSPSGSSSGSAVGVAANLCAAAIGSETDGSIVSPASINGIVGLKPTVGLVSRRGMIPLAQSQDTAGPLTRSVRDAALLLGIMSGSDPADPASAAAAGRFESDYVRYLDRDGLRGARLGIARNFFAENPPLNRFLDGCVARLKQAGALIVDPANLAKMDDVSTAELDVLLYEFKSGLDAYLARLPAKFTVRSLDDLIRFNDAHAASELALFDQELLRQAQAKGTLADAAYREARAICVKATRENGIDALTAEHRLDAIVTLTCGPAWLIDPINGDFDTGGCSMPAAVAGYPHISVPAGLYRGLPIGLSFFGPAFSEGRLLRVASGFEAVSPAAVRPEFKS